MTDQSKQQAESESLPGTEEEWRRRLTPEQFEVLRNKGTERAFTGAYASTKERGVYRCAGCAAELFSSETKFESGTGWPSFWEPIERGAWSYTKTGAFGCVAPRSRAPVAAATSGMSSRTAPSRPATATA
jgi:methionine-R-sulfoxide reductase